MRFPESEINAILTGRRQQFRVPTGLPATRFNPAAKTHSVMPEQIDLDTGKLVEVDPLVHLTVIERRIEPLAFVTASDVQAEGYKRPEQLWQAFLKRWNIRQYDAPEVTVHVVTFEIEREQRPQYMARQQGILNPPQYVNNPARAIDEAEVMDTGLLSAEWGRRSTDNYVGANSAKLRKRANRARIEQLRANVSIAEKAGTNVDAELAEIDKLIARLGEKADPASATAERKVA